MLTNLLRRLKWKKIKLAFINIFQPTLKFKDENGITVLKIKGKLWNEFDKTRFIVSNKPLRNIFKNEVFKDITFDNVSFSESAFENCKFIECTFVNCSAFLGVLFSKCEFTHTHFRSFTSPSFTDNTFNECSINGAIHGAIHGSTFRNCKFIRTELPSPTAMLLAEWGNVSEQLCADLMEFDAACHEDRGDFDRWANPVVGPKSSGAVRFGHRVCPYWGKGYGRSVRFYENPEIWKKGIGKIDTPYNLMMRLFQEKGITISKE